MRVTAGGTQILLFMNRELAVRIEEDMRKGNREVVAAWNSEDSKSAAVSLERDGVLAVYGGSDCPINEAVGLGMSKPVKEGTLNAIEDFYASHGHATVIRVCPLAHSSLMDMLRQRNYAISAFTYRWVLDLTAWNSAFDEQDSRVRVARPDEEWIWARTVAAGFADVDEGPKTDGMELDRAFFRMPSATSVLAVIDNQPAAGGVVAVNDGLAALFVTSTRPSFRHLGLQTALLDWRLRYAKAQGARVATIETDVDSNSQRNVERMGFRMAYTVVQMTREEN